MSNASWASAVPTTAPCAPFDMSANSAARLETGSASNGMTHLEANTTAPTRACDISPVSCWTRSVPHVFRECALTTCPGLSKSPNAASFVRPTRPVEKPRTFLEALRAKYASEVAADQTPISSGPQIVISGKVAEEIGFDKIRRQQGQLGELKIVILDGMRIDSASNADGRQESIRDVCPKVTELNLSRNLLVSVGTVVDICSCLSDLRGLRLE